MARRFIVRPPAEADLEEAARWYEDERGYLGFCVIRVGLSCNDTDPTTLPGAGLSANHDFDVLVERGEQVH